MTHSKLCRIVILVLISSWTGFSIHSNNANIIDDKNWNNAIQSCGNIRINDSEILLETQFDQPPVFAFDPTDDETITCMKEYKGKLYIGSCTAPGLTDTGSVFIYDPEKHAWEKAFQVNEQGLIRLEVYNDILYIPGYDANDGGWDLGNIYIHDGKTWVEKRAVPRAVHTYGIAAYKDRIYLSADILDQPSEGISLTSGRVPIYGRVVSSSDNGSSWREEFRTPVQGQNIGLMTVFKDQIVLNAMGDLVIFDGKKWKFLNDGNASFLYVLEYFSDDNLLLIGTPFGLCYFDGKRLWRSVLFDWGYIRGICKLGNHWVFTHYTLRDGYIYHGPTGTHNYPALKYGSQKPTFWADITIIPDEVLKQDLVAGRNLIAMDKNKMWATSIKMFQIMHVPTSACVCRGRVYIGTHPEGYVLVLPVAKQGFIESSIYGVAEPGTYKIDWDSATPPGTSIRFQIRTGATKQTLSNSEFIGPDRTEQSYFEKSGETFTISEKGFIQYRAILSTDDPVKSPYLKRVVISKQK
ncbi:MAG: hypothetical protein NC906_00650 [Candidatus Omnitrophica bacterium]|nr:hypothetical protein [Candidatus Omnitrophota bacterium]